MLNEKMVDFDSNVGWEMMVYGHWIVVVVWMVVAVVVVGRQCDIVDVPVEPHRPHHTR